MTILFLLKIEYKSPINAVSLRLVLSICIASTFNQALIKFLKSQFVPSLDLFDDQHNCYHARKNIAINKEFGIYSGPYHLDILFLLVFTIKTIDKVVGCYLQLL